jgi:hypothetical protein
MGLLVGDVLRFTGLGVERYAELTGPRAAAPAFWPAAGTVDATVRGS